MSDAAKARAEARKKAILSGRTNRLAKLTSTARGEEAAAAFIRDAQAQEKAQAIAQAQADAQVIADDPPLPSLRDTALRDFVGESTPFGSLTPSPGPSRAVTPSYGTDVSSRTRADSGLDSPPPVWTSEQEELLRRIMGGPSGTSPPDLNTADPLAAMMSMFSGPGGPLGEILGGEGGGGIPPALKNLGMADAALGGSGPIPSMPFMAPTPPGPPKPKLFLVRCLPLLHIIATVALCVWFVVFAEPAAYAVARAEDLVASKSLWARWAMLAQRESEAFGVHQMPFILAFITLQLVLHSISVFYDPIVFEPTGLLGMAIPHLPKPLPSVIMHSMKYLKLGGALLDDLSIVIFIFGVTIWLASLSGH
ncbi:hypothetical protein FRC12_019263 [Ceratobasidium sp. 428]|nr:hypothetical protein FRC12_019263 [Ceratobasidium sp. 428]